jgi:hypothetical protein
VCLRKQQTKSTGLIRSRTTSAKHTMIQTSSQRHLPYRNSRTDVRNVLLCRDYDRILAEQAKTPRDETSCTATTANSNSWTCASQSTKTTSESHSYGTTHSVKNQSVNTLSPTKKQASSSTSQQRSRPSQPVSTDPIPMA